MASRECGCSSMVERQPSKLITWVRFPSPAPLDAGPDVYKRQHLIQQQQTFGDITYHFVGTVGPTALSGSTGTPANRGTLTIDWTRGPLSIGTVLNYRSAMQGIDASNDTCLLYTSRCV